MSMYLVTSRLLPASSLFPVFAQVEEIPLLIVLLFDKIETFIVQKKSLQLLLMVFIDDTRA